MAKLLLLCRVMTLGHAAEPISGVIDIGPNTGPISVFDRADHESIASKFATQGRVHGPRASQPMREDDQWKARHLRCPLWLDSSLHMADQV